MKLLIVDDEQLTRKGIQESLDLKALSVDQVILADDGLHGLEEAKKNSPDLVLTDVRMPRMTGVEMAERILKEDPDVSIVFMSAYSDKEYLKAAIKLKAVSYVEKPLDLEELQASLKEAAENRLARLHSRSIAQSHEKHLLAKLALELTEKEHPQEDIIWQLIQDLKLPFTSSTSFSTLVVRFLTPISELSSDVSKNLNLRFEDSLKAYSIQRIYTFHADQDMIIHLYSDRKLEEKKLKFITRRLTEDLRSACHFFLARGPVVSGTERIPYSYEQAMKILEHSFFFELDSELPEQISSGSTAPLDDLLPDFLLALTNEQEAQALNVAEKLHASVSPTLLTASQTRDLYYKYLGKLDEYATAKHISLWSRPDGSLESIWDSASACITLSQLNQLFVGKLKRFFSILKEGQGEHPTVFQIKEFIHQNYPLPTLSVPDISDHVNLSSSYVCTLFKTETGQTLNQYLNEYRIRMSKQLLADQRFKITDISSKVGYSDGNYYSKAFKKMVGLSPSEYREKMLS